MRKAKSLMLAMFFTGYASYAQIGGIEDSVNEVSDTVRTIFPIILGVIFLIGFLFNAGHFFGENADLKKGIKSFPMCYPLKAFSILKKYFPRVSAIKKKI